MIIRVFVLLAFCLSALPPVSWAADNTQPAFDQLEQDLDWVEWLLDNGRGSSEDVKQLRTRVRASMEAAQKVGPIAEEKTNSLKRQLEALDPAPAEDEEPEAAEVASRRQQLEEELALQEGRLQRIGLIVTRGGELLERIAATESRAAAAAVLTRDAHVFDSTVWRRALAQAAPVPGDVYDRAASLVSRLDLVHSALAGGTALLLFTLLRVWILRRTALRTHGARKDRVRFLPALATLVANGVLPAAILASIFAPSFAAGRFGAGQMILVQTVLAVVAAPLILRAWVHVVLFSADTPRLVRLRRTYAVALVRWVYGLAGFLIASFVLYQFRRLELVQTELYQCAQLVLRLIIAGTFLYMLPLIGRARRAIYDLNTRLSAPVIQGLYAALFLLARVAGPAVALVSPSLLAAGYWRLSDWLFFGVLGSSLLLLMLWLIRNAAREVVTRALSSPRHAPAGRPVGKGFGGTTLLWVLAGLNLALWLGAMTCLLLIWRIPLAQITAWTSTFLFSSVTIAEVKISVSDVLLAVITFCVLVAFTRIVQRQLQRRFLSWAPLDSGARNALWRVTGYVGVSVAVVTALLSMGVNLSQLFLILGALSVGIGFGLQSVVHNFISGLILLFERPVRIGDWITVGDDDGRIEPASVSEGRVERIGARASLIRTAADTDLWIPNSRLVSSRLINWTLRDPAGRIQIEVPVDTDADERSMTKILLEAANAHPGVTAAPAPDVFLQQIGVKGYTLVLYATVAQINNRMTVESELRYAIRKALREACVTPGPVDERTSVQATTGSEAQPLPVACRG